MYDKLVKEIDSLTYNSRTVLNGMIRSTVAGGSDSGFSVTRAGIKVELSRVDIYRLSKFYSEWEVNNFSLVDVSATSTSSEIKSFDTIRQEQDSTPVRNDDGSISSTSATTNALVNHSRVLYMSDTNSSNSADQTDFWLNTLTTNSENNPKLITNSAPIPLNLRSPVYNENLATTKYNSNPTYLFPKSYYDLDTLGFSGDAVDHNLDGQSWTITSDDFVNINSPKISIGTIDSSSTYKTQTNRVAVDAFVWGRDTHARGNYATAGGVSSIATANGSVAIGTGVIASAWKAIAMGQNNEASGPNTAVIGGKGNYSVTDYSGAYAGHNNNTGSVIDDWTKVVIDPNDECLKEIIECTVQENDLDPYSNIIVISGNALDRYALDETVRVFSYTYGDGTSTVLNQDGNAESSVIAKLQNVTYDSINDETKLVLDTSINYSGIAGGKISKIKSSTGQYYGYGSFVTGSENVAMGNYQAVVGRYNRIDSVAKFIVGTGTSDTNRRNSLEIYQDKSIIYGSDVPDLPDVSTNGYVNLNRFVGGYFDKNTANIQSQNGYLQINDTLPSSVSLVSTNGMYISWGENSKLTFGGDTFETLAVSSVGRAHHLTGKLDDGNIKRLDRSGFYFINPGVTDNLGESIGDGNNNESWHLINNTITTDNVDYSMQLAKNIFPGADNSRLSYRSISVNSSGTVTADEWETVATSDDLDTLETTLTNNLDTYIDSRANDGVWKSHFDGDFTMYARQLSINSDDETYDININTSGDNNSAKTMEFTYTTIGNTMYYKIMMFDLVISRSNITAIKFVPNIQFDIRRFYSQDNASALFLTNNNQSIFAIPYVENDDNNKLAFNVKNSISYEDTFPTGTYRLQINGTLQLEP